MPPSTVMNLREYYKHNPDKLIEFGCGIKLKSWQRWLLRMCRLYRSEGKR